MYNIKPLQLLKGIATYVPRSQKLYDQPRRDGTISARYCYSVWLRHLTIAYQNGLSTQPDVSAELGPGSTLGTGLAALLSGTNKYYAFDVVESANYKRNAEIFDELTELFKKREKIPNETEFPRIQPYLESYEFPHHILTDERLNQALKQDRIEAIRNALSNLESKDEGGIQIAYFVPWSDSRVMEKEIVDMIYSQAVLEHIHDLSHTYEAMHHWLKPGGFMSHSIDFKCHNLAKDWNGHWAYPDFLWRLTGGKRAPLLNRQPHSTHINLLQQLNFDVACDIKIEVTAGMKRKYLASRFRGMSDDDLTTSGAFIQAIKKKRHG